MQHTSTTLSPAQAAPMLLSVTDASRALGMSRSWIYGQIRAGLISSVKLGYKTMVPTAEVRRIVSGGLQEPAE